MDDYQNDYYAGQRQPQNTSYYNDLQNRSINSFSIASMVMGIGSIVLCCTGFLSLPMGALGVLFAILSRRKAKSMPGMSIAGICTSICGMILGLIAAAYIIIILVIAANPSMHHYLDPIYQEAYGMDFEEFMEHMGYPLE